MIHTENFVLVDRKRIRRFYDGTDDKDIQILKKDIDILIEVQVVPKSFLQTNHFRLILFVHPTFYDFR